MKRQVMKMVHMGVYKVIYDDEARFNPYKVYHIGYGTDGNKHQGKVAEYALMSDAILHLESIVRGYEKLHRIG